jgi:hypothetical protein
MTKKLSDYARELEDLGHAQDFVLHGVWEALEHGPTYVLTDGSRLRPLTAKILLRRSPLKEGDCFEIVGYAHVCNENVTAREPEPAWRTTSS